MTENASPTVSAMRHLLSSFEDLLTRRQPLADSRTSVPDTASMVELLRRFETKRTGLSSNQGEGLASMRGLLERPEWKGVVSDFNVFEEFAVTDEEVLQSRFIACESARETWRLTLPSSHLQRLANCRLTSILSMS